MPLEPWSESFIYRGVTCQLWADHDGSSLYGVMGLDMPGGQHYAWGMRVSARNIESRAAQKRARYEAKKIAVNLLRMRRSWPDA